MGEKRKNNRDTNDEIRPTREHKVVRGRPAVPQSNSQRTDKNRREYQSAYRPSGKTVRRTGKNKKRSSLKKKIFLVIAVILIVSVLSCIGLFHYIFDGMVIHPITTDLSSLGVDRETAAKSKNAHVVNIALFGVDSRNLQEDTGRSDSIMILSVNRKDNTLKLTSVLRDSKVSIDGHGQEKIAHAYAYGGPELAIKTLNQNFHLDIQDYVTVNFTQMAQVVDAIGGIDIEITEAERRQINVHANTDGLSAPAVTASGMVHLNGAQATGYARIRAIDSDNARADRQKKVLQCMLNQVKSMSKLKYPKLLKTILPMVETSLDYTDIISFAPMILKDLSLEQNSVPNEEDHAKGGGNPWVWTYDLDAASQRLHAFIYGA